MDFRRFFDVDRGEASLGLKKLSADSVADVCILSEGAYPYVSGGVSSWIHGMIEDQPHLRFHIVTLVVNENLGESRYSLPENVVGLSHVYLQSPPSGKFSWFGFGSLMDDLEPPLRAFMQSGSLDELGSLIRVIEPYRGRVGASYLLNSEAAWRFLQRMYEEINPETSFLNFFWTWRSILSGLFAVLLAPLPAARVYHAVSTGYAGLLAARAGVETGASIALTEHGIYTNERRLELTMADWLFEGSDHSYKVDLQEKNLAHVWMTAFEAYAQACYRACDRIITLYQGNQVLQCRDGADPEKSEIIPNGIDFERFSKVSILPRKSRPPTVALVGRAVSIKDIKTYIRACSLLVRDIPDLQAWVLGPTEEEPEYFSQCQALVEQLGLENTFTFHGQVQLTEYFGKIDCLVLTSVSEAQPLVILEAAAAGVPSVSTDVGSCREILEGTANEDDQLGLGGEITAVAAPLETAAALKRMLLDEQWRNGCGGALKERVRCFYNKKTITKAYGELYQELILRPDSMQRVG